MRRNVQLLALAGCVAACLAVAWWATSGRLRSRNAAVSPAEERARSAESALAAVPNRTDLTEPSDSGHRAEESVPASTGDPAHIAVLVRSKGSHFPLKGWRLRLVEGDRPSSLTDAQDHDAAGAAVPADANGRVEFLAPAGRKLTLVGWDDHGKREDASFEIAPLAAGESRSMAVEFATSEDVHLRCRILSRADRTPIEGAKVYVLMNIRRGELMSLSDRTGLIAERKPDAVSDRAGIAELWAPDRIQVCLEVRAPGYGPARIGTRDGAGDAIREVLLDRCATLRVRVLESDSRLPVDQARVELSADPSSIRQPLQAASVLASQNDDPLGWTADTNADGACRLEDLPPNVDLHVALGRKGAVTKRLDPLLRLDPGETRDVEYRLGGLCKISGQISDEHGSPVPSVQVCAERARDDSRTYSKPTTTEGCAAEAQSDGLGHYELRPLPPGRWWIGPKSEMALKSADGKLSLLVPVIVEVREGADAMTVDLQVREALFIGGRVVDATGAGAWSSVVASGIDTTMGDYNLSQQDGTFSIGPLLPGSYRLTARAMGGPSAKLDSVQAGASDVVIQLPASFKRTGVVVDGSTHQPCLARVMVSRKGTQPDAEQFATENTGRFETSGLEAGDWVFSAYTDDGRFGGGFETTIDNAQDCGPIEIEVFPAGRVRVRIEGGTLIGGIFVESEGAIVNMGGGTGLGHPGETAEMIVPLTELSIQCTVDGLTRIAHTRVAHAGDVVDVTLR